MNVTQLCWAAWYDGERRIKHRCHRKVGHHADSGLTWSRHPHYRTPRITSDQCPECQPAMAERR